MANISEDLIIKEIPLFSGLSQKEINFIRQRSTFVEYKKGANIYQEGSPADAFYCIVFGRVMIYTQDRMGNDIILEYLHRGKYFGIISLLTGEPHSVSAKTLNDSVCLAIKKEDFDLILEKIPHLAIDLSRTLSRRLKNKDVHQKTIFESSILSVFSSYSQAGKTIYALNLGLSLKKETRKKVAILEVADYDRPHSLVRMLNIKDGYKVFNLSDSESRAVKEFVLKNEFGVDLICLSYQSEDDISSKKLIDILSLLVNDYHYIILDLPARMDRFVFSVLNQSDFIHILTSPEQLDLKRTAHLIDRLKTEFIFQEDKIKVVINEYKASKLTYEETIKLLGHSVFATLPKIEISSSDRLVLDQPDTEYAKAMRRISRQVSDSLIGLVLGVGVGYGFCHIGVLRVIEEENIPIDVICGASIGAVMASLWATGRSSSEILAITQEFREPKSFWNMVDLTLPFLSFIKGNKLRNFLKKYLGNKTFYDVRLPLKIVASDVRRKESVVFDKGLIIDAVMASCAMPGVFRPFKFKEEVLFDGGVTNPLPTEPLLKMGIKKIIAVNVTPSREDVIRQYEKLKEEITKPHSFKTNIIDIIFSSVEALQSEVARKEGQLADIVLHPDTTGMHWLELHRAADFAKRGEEETRRNLDRIKQIINE